MNDARPEDEVPWKALAAPFAVALIVRLWNLDSQVFGDDELHAVRTALALPLSRILETYHSSDNSIPITAAYRIWMDAGGQLTDYGMRFPVLLASVLLVVLGPRLAAPLCGAAPARLWAWALALSPLLVTYGRLARSYAAVLLLGTLAVLGLVRFMRGDPARYAALFVFCGAGAVWFHPGAGPFVVAAFVGAAVSIALGESRRSLGELAVVGLAIASVGVALLLRTIDSLQRLVADKVGWDTLNLASVLEAATLFAGVRSGAVAALLWALVVYGAVALWRSNARSLAAAVLVTLLGQALGLLLLSPDMSSALYTLRAFLVCLPLLLLAAVAGLDAAAAATGLGTARRRAALVAFLVAWVALGPFVEPALWATPYRQHDDYILFTQQRPQLEAVPGFYEELASAPEGPVVEMPWHPFWGFGHAVPAYQERHGRDVFVGNLSELGSHSSLRWRRYVRAEPVAVLATPARFAIVHLDFELEERAARLARLEPGGKDLVKARPEHWNPLREEGRFLARRFDSVWGPADYNDGVTAVWDLGRVREN